MTLLFAQIEFPGHHREPNKKLGVLWDEIIWHTDFQSVKKYPGELRLIEFQDEKSGKTYRLLRSNSHGRFRQSGKRAAPIVTRRSAVTARTPLRPQGDFLE